MFQQKRIMRHIEHKTSNKQTTTTNHILQRHNN